jgi:hypothetical protein
MHRRSRAGEVEDLVNLDVEGKRHVVTKQLNPMVIEQMRDIVPRAREKIVDTENLVAAFEKPLAEMRAQKACAPSDKNTFRYCDRHIIPWRMFILRREPVVAA